MSNGWELCYALPTKHAFRAWVHYVDEQRTAGDRHIVVPGTYGTDSAKPNKGTYPRFSDDFYRLKANFENLLEFTRSHRFL